MYAYCAVGSSALRTRADFSRSLKSARRGSQSVALRASGDGPRKERRKKEGKRKPRCRCEFCTETLAFYSLSVLTCSVPSLVCLPSPPP